MNIFNAYYNHEWSNSIVYAVETKDGSFKEWTTTVNRATKEMIDMADRDLFCELSDWSEETIKEFYSANLVTKGKKDEWVFNGKQYHDRLNALVDAVHYFNKNLN